MSYKLTTSLPHVSLEDIFPTEILVREGSTGVELFNQLSRTIVTSYKATLYGRIPNLPLYSKSDARNLQELIDMGAALEKNLREYRSINLDSLDKNTSVLTSYFEREERRLLDEHNSKLQSLVREKEAIISSIQSNHRSDLETLKQQRDEVLDRKIEDLSYLFEKLEDIENRFNSISGLESVYMLNESVTLDINKLSIEFIKEIIDKSELALDSFQSNNYVDKVIQLLYLPADVDFGENQSRYSALYLIFLTLFIILLDPISLGVLGFIFIVSLLYKVYKVYSHSDILLLAKMVKENRVTIEQRIHSILLRSDEVVEMNRELKGRELDNIEEEIKNACIEINELIEEHNSVDPLSELNEIKNVVLTKDKTDQVLREMHTVLDESKKFLDRRINAAQTELESVNAEIQKYSDELLKFGSYISDSKVLSTEFIIGSREYKPGILLDYQKVEFPYKNYVFKYNDKNDYNKAVDRLKLLLVNSLLNVRENCLEVTIIDPIRLGNSFAEFFSVELEKTVKKYTGDVNEKIDEIKTTIDETMAKINDMSVSEYNAESVELKRATIPYKIYIFASFDESLYKNKDFESLMEMSYEYGIQIWLLADKLVSEEYTVSIEEDGKFREYTSIMDYNHPAFTPINYTVHLGNSCVDTITKAISENRMDIVWYESDFRPLVIPEDKIWQYNTLDGIELNFGFLDGDPSKPTIEKLGDAPVHAIMVGASGSGKSVAVDTVLMSLLHKYPPEWLELVMVDFKRMEAQKYTGDYTIPHAKIISGTKDGEYALSIFKYLIDEMNRRQKICGARGAKDSRELNKMILRGDVKGEDIHPRILVLFDEFLSMFENVGDDELIQIKSYMAMLAREARASGIHLWFTSQNMEGTLSDGVLEQFGLRIALRSSSETSRMILGNDASSTLPDKGWLHTNSKQGLVSHNHKYNIPLAPPEYLRKTMLMFNKKCAEEGYLHRRAVFYDEEEMFPVSKMDSYFDLYPVLQREKNLVILGEPTDYTTSKLPVHFKLFKQSGENIAIATLERKDTCNLLLTMLKNFSRDKDAIICGTLVDRDVEILTDAMSYINENFKEMTDELNIDTITDILTVEMEARKDTYNEDVDHSVYYFMLNCDKLTYKIKDDYNYADKLKRLLQEGPPVGIHVISFCKNPNVLYRLLNDYSHIIASKTTEGFSGDILGDRRASRLSQGIAIYKYTTSSKKFKIYVSEYDESKLPKRTLDL